MLKTRFQACKVHIQICEYDFQYCNIVFIMNFTNVEIIFTIVMLIIIYTKMNFIRKNYLEKVYRVN